MKYRIRKKGNFADGSPKYVVEQMDKGKVVGSRTLSRPEKMWKDMNQDTKQDIKPQFNPILGKNDSQNYAYELLNEPKKTKKKKTLTDAEKQWAWEMTK